MAQVKELIGEPTAHCEICIDAAKSVLYCKKEGHIVEFGTLPEKGRGERTDWKKFVEASKSQKDGLAMFETFPKEMCLWSKAYDKIRKLQDEKDARATRFVAMNVIVVHGATGTGKSRGARDKYPDIYNVPLQPKQVWFGPSYTGQKSILLDDFAGQIDYRTLLKWCDGYQMEVPVKGGFVEKQWDTVVITSTTNVSDWYPGEPDYSEFRRRVSRFVELPEDTAYWCPAMQQPGGDATASTNVGTVQPGGVGSLVYAGDLFGAVVAADPWNRYGF